MALDSLYTGFKTDFLNLEDHEQVVNLPVLEDVVNEDIAFINLYPNGVIPYINYSLVLSAERKFAYYTATNIDGTQFKKVPRKDAWRLDARLKDMQWGYELYSADKANFDRGHLTKREDVQWGATVGVAFKAADSTFYYANSVPQHRHLNRDVWRSLEDYILHAETTERKLRISVITGPVLSETDPFFCTSVRGKSIKLPILFWKIVYFVKEDCKLYRAGFLMSQQSLLEADGIIEEVESDSSQNELFNQFRYSGTYQVNVSLIEQLTDMTFSAGIDSYRDQRPISLIFKEIDIDPDLESDSLEQLLGFEILNLQL